MCFVDGTVDGTTGARTLNGAPVYESPHKITLLTYQTEIKYIEPHYSGGVMPSATR